MGWVKRSANTVIPTERTAPIYPPCSFNFTIVLHHHGKFNNTMTAYEEGAVDYFDFCNVDEMSMIEIKEMMKMCGIDVKSVKCYLSKNGINCCRQLEEVVTDIDAYRLGFSIDAICCLNFQGFAVENYVDDCYKRSTYMEVYKHVMQPIKGQNEWPKSDLPILLPPIPEKMPGRPKKNSRKKSSIELQEIRAKIALQKAAETGRLGRHGMIMHCSYCSNPGHNKRSCAKIIAKQGEGSGSAGEAKKKKKEDKCTYCKMVGHKFEECLQRIVDDESEHQKGDKRGRTEDEAPTDGKKTTRRRQLFKGPKESAINSVPP